MKCCVECKLIVEKGKVCPACEGQLTDKFSGILVVVDPEKSEIANLLGKKIPGKYALKLI